ncbi:MAG: nickel-responsive transcriptional regulator NikR [Ignavibacteria bacterium]|jgi:CopG family nickel-responsive transcriptional regulator|nr:nickel-responsive transcriptional regulator NikR [Ignavibacteria bacterium]MDH7526614.1 nickel-responsive transcriptional regulator NikR [Ignavibacteria bacterium]NPV11450.1 nickel-responsive transcriptional regulator NikR [Ignavibacteria bacterium]
MPIRRKKKDELYRFGVSMEYDLIQKFDKYLEKRGFYNRSEAIRDLVRQLLAKEKVEIKNEVTYGIVSFIYNHHQRELEERITHLQHHNFKSIISTTHIHIDEEYCLEVIIMKDRAQRIKTIAEAIFSLKGVKSGEVSFVTLV